MIAHISEFKRTRDLFAEFTGYTRPLSYEEWLAIPDDHKAAVLFCQFFEPITLAWYKLRSCYSVESDGVDEVMKYLQKAVDGGAKKNPKIMIKGNPSRFNARYIYRVSYNCLYCLCRDPNRYKRTYENECSNIAHVGEDELDLFDEVTDPGNIDDLSSLMNGGDKRREDFWKIIEDVGSDAVTVVCKLLGEQFDWTQGKMHRNQKTWNARAIDSSEFESVSKEREAEIICILRERLVGYLDYMM